MSKIEKSLLEGKSIDVIPKLKSTFDPVFIDHWKGDYYDSLVLLEEHNCITSGSVLTVNNVILFEKALKEYFDRVRNSELEFDKQTVDGLEISVMR